MSKTLVEDRTKSVANDPGGGHELKPSSWSDADKSNALQNHAPKITDQMHWLCRTVKIWESEWKVRSNIKTLRDEENQKLEEEMCHKTDELKIEESG